MIERDRGFRGDEFASEPSLNRELFDDRLRGVGKAGGKKKEERRPVEKGVSARDQLEVYLSMPPGESRNRVMEGFLAQRGSKLNVEDLRRAAQSFNEEPVLVTAPKPVVSGVVTEAKKRIEIPKEPEELRLFLRARVRDVIRITTNEDTLSVKSVISEIKLALGFDKETQAQVDLFEGLSGGVKEDVRAEVEAEIEHRCLLRLAELKEFSYKEMADKGAAVNRFLNDIKGSESGAASAAVIHRDTFKWLKGLRDEGDGLKRENIDMVFQLLVMLGENPEGYAFEADLSGFQRFLGVKDNNDKVRNFYDPAYPDSIKDAAIGLMKTKFGDDSYTLAWQMFQAFKEEGNYNWQHYLSRDFTFSSTRFALAEILTPPVYVGSRRVYSEEIILRLELAEAKKKNITDDIKRLSERLKEIKNIRKSLRDKRNEARKGLEAAKAGGDANLIKNAQTKLEETTVNLEPYETFSDQLRQTAVSALRAAIFKPDPDKPGRPLQNNDEVKTTERDVLLSRAKRGAFLAETPFENKDLVPDGKMPQQLSYATIKDGEKLRSAIVAVGDLGKEGDKASRIEAAITALADLRGTGESLIEAKVITREELDRQIRIEARNILWEMTVENPANVRDLGTQSKAKPAFLMPSQLNIFFEKMGGIAGETRLLGSDADYSWLAGTAKDIIEKTLEVLKSPRLPRSDSEDGDRSLIDREEKAARLVLPRIRGGGVGSGIDAGVEAYLNRVENITDRLGRFLHGVRYVPR